MARKVLLIVIDQFRADCLSGSLAQAAPLPNLQALMKQSVCFDQHYTVTTPCGPSRASLLTGLYAMNHRSVRNATPLAAHHKTIGTHMRSVGYEPMLFGYTDVSADPRNRHANDPDLKNYEGLAPGFAEMVRLRFETPGAWLGYLKHNGYEVPGNYWDLYKAVPDPSTASVEFPDGSPIRSPARYAAEHSDTAFLTDRTIEELAGRENEDWFSLLTYIRPHPPLVAPAPYNTLYAPDTLPLASHAQPLKALKSSHPFYDAHFSENSDTGLFIGFDGNLAGMSDASTAELRAVYLGLATEVDHHIGRLLDYLRESGQYDDTLIVVTADHGEMLGDNYLWGKNFPFDPALHIPLIIRDPAYPDTHGSRVNAFTESVDVAPTLLDCAGGGSAGHFDGESLKPFLAGSPPRQWRKHVFAEAELGEPDKPTRYQTAMGLSLDQSNYAVLRDGRHKYVHFNGGLPPMLFDLTADPQEVNNRANDSAQTQAILELSARMLDHRMTHADRSLSRLKLTDKGVFKGK